MSSDRSLPLLTLRQWRILGSGIAALHERESNKPEEKRLFSLEEIETLHKLAYDQWVETHASLDWTETEDGP